jgi:hypothetical protein
MEARAAFREPGISKKAVWFIFALMAALLLGGTGAYVLRAASSPTAPAATHIVLGQGAGGAGSAWNYSNQRHGTQTVEGPAATAAQNESGSRRSGTQIVP